MMGEVALWLFFRGILENGSGGNVGKKSENLSCQNDDPDMQKVSQTPYEYFVHSGEAPARILRKIRNGSEADKSRKKSFFVRQTVTGCTPESPPSFFLVSFPFRPKMWWMER